ncbi:MAG TPA: DinB family protein [Roseiflexaceae bacterium]|nr:DinB family protein [Roseiflexaceae bacterium]
MNEDELRRIFTSSSMGQVAYRAWAEKARHERRNNVARLFEALSAARMARAEHAFRQLGEVGSTLENVERALTSPEPEAVATGRITGTTAVSRELLARARAALAEGRDLRADELGDLYVCGTCGEIREGKLSGACQVCGTVPEAHRAFRAIESMGTLGPHAIMSFLEHSEESLRKLLEGLDDALLSRRPSEDLPSLKELAGHLADMDAVFRERAWLLLETDRPELPPAHPPKLNMAVAYRTKPVEQILEAYHNTRRQTLSLLRGLTSAAWHRTGHHELYGEVNLLHQGNWVINHERSHLVEMAQLRHDLLAASGGDGKTTDVTGVVVTGVNEGE